MARTETRPDVIEGMGPPLIIPSNPGDIYVDLLNHETYIAAGATDNTDWIQGGGEAEDVEVDSENFDGNLADTDDTVQKVAQKVDDLTLALLIQRTVGDISIGSKALLAENVRKSTRIDLNTTGLEYLHGAGYEILTLIGEADIRVGGGFDSD